MSAAADSFAGYAVRPRCCVVLTGPAAVLDVLRSLQQSAERCRRDGFPVPPRVLHLIALCEAELAAHRATSADGSAEVPFEPTSAESVAEELVEVAEVAELLGVTTRQARNLAEQLAARKVAGRWVFDRQAVLLEVGRRREEGAEASMREHVERGR